MKRFILILLSLIFFSSCSRSSEETIDSSYGKSTRIKDGWDLSAKTTIDSKEKAIRLSHSGINWRTSDRAISKFKYPAIADKTYTISLKSKTNTWPPPSVEISGSYYSGEEFISNSLGSMITNSKVGEWEESTVYIDIPNNKAINRFTIRIIDLPKRGKDGNIWIKDVTFNPNYAIEHFI